MESRCWISFPPKTTTTCVNNNNDGDRCRRSLFLQGPTPPPTHTHTHTHTHTRLSLILQYYLKNTHNTRALKDGSASREIWWLHRSYCASPECVCVCRCVCVGVCVCVCVCVCVLLFLCVLPCSVCLSPRVYMYVQHAPMSCLFWQFTIRRPLPTRDSCQTAVRPTGRSYFFTWQGKRNVLWGLD